MMTLVASCVAVLMGGWVWALKMQLAELNGKVGRVAGGRTRVVGHGVVAAGSSDGSCARKEGVRVWTIE